MGTPEIHRQQSFGSGMPPMIREIPGTLFAPRNKGMVETGPEGSGRNLHYAFGRDTLWLSYEPSTVARTECEADIETPEWTRSAAYPHFAAYIAPYKDAACLRFSVRSVIDDPLVSKYTGVPLGDRHPGIGAARLLQASLVYFEYLWQRQIRYLKDAWEPGTGSSNTAQFEAYERAHCELPDEERRQQAAFATWTGRQALKHGFTIVTVSEPNAASAVQALFERP